MSGDAMPVWAAAMEARLATGIGDLRAGLGAEVAGLRTEVADTRAGIMARIDRLPGALTRVQEGGVVELGSAEQSLRRAESAQGEVRALTDRALTDMMQALNRLLRRMQTDIDQIRDAKE